LNTIRDRDGGTHRADAVVSVFHKVEGLYDAAYGWVRLGLVTGSLHDYALVSGTKDQAEAMVLHYRLQAMRELGWVS
jgi:hypothetical protein